MLNRTGMNAPFDFVEHKDVLPYEPTMPPAIPRSRDVRSSRNHSRRTTEHSVGVPPIRTSYSTGVFQNRHLRAFFEDTTMWPEGRPRAVMTVKQTPSTQILLNTAERELAYTVVYKCETNGIQVRISPIACTHRGC